MLANRIPASYPGCALKFPEMILHFVSFKPTKTSIISSTNSGYGAIEFGAHTGRGLATSTLNMHTFSKRYPFIDTVCQLSLLSLGEHCWHECRLRVAFKFPREEVLCAVPIRLFRCVAGATCGLHLWIADAVDCRDFFKWTCVPTALRWFFIMRVTTDAQWFWLILRISYSNCPNCTVNHTGRTISTAILRYEGYYGKA